MLIGQYVKTLRFCRIKIDAVFSADAKEAAVSAGFTEPTHYQDIDWIVYGKSIGQNRMIFAAVGRE